MRKVFHLVRVGADTTKWAGSILLASAARSAPPMPEGGPNHGRNARRNKELQTKKIGKEVARGFPRSGVGRPSTEKNLANPTSGSAANRTESIIGSAGKNNVADGFLEVFATKKRRVGRAGTTK